MWGRCLSKLFFHVSSCLARGVSLDSQGLIPVNFEKLVRKLQRTSFCFAHCCSGMSAARISTEIMLLLAVLTLGSEAGLDGCPCLSSVDLTSYQNGASLTFSISGSNYNLPLDYGLGCNQHDVGTDPSCSRPGCSPPWCSQSWCWVDKNNCQMPDAGTSGYFPGSGVYYSYSTCGSVDSFSGFYNTLSTTPRTTNLVHPLVSATSCVYITSPSDACGPLVQGRTNFSNDWCELKQQVESGDLAFADVLSGRMLDISLTADDATWIDDAAGGQHPGLGMR